MLTLEGLIAVLSFGLTCFGSWAVVFKAFLVFEPILLTNFSLCIFHRFHHQYQDMSMF